MSTKQPFHLFHDARKKIMIIIELINYHLGRVFNKGGIGGCGHVTLPSKVDKVIHFPVNKV